MLQWRCMLTWAALHATCEGSPSIGSILTLQERCMLTWAPRTWARRMLLPPSSRADKHLPRALLAISAVCYLTCSRQHNSGG